MTTHQSIFCLFLLTGFGGWANADEQQKPSADEQAVREIVRGYFEATAKKDVDDLLDLFHPESPGRSLRSRTMTAIFQTTGRIRLRNFAVRSVTVKGDVALVRTTAVLTGRNTSDFRQHNALGRVERFFTLRRAKGSWKIWGYGRDSERLVDLFLETNEKADRVELLEETPRFTGLLPNLLENRAYQLLQQNDTKSARRANEVAREIADHANSAVDRAWGLLYQGLVLEHEKSYDESLQVLQKAQSAFEREELTEGQALALICQGRCLVENGKPKLAVRKFQEAERLDRIVPYLAASSRLARLPGLGKVYSDFLRDSEGLHRQIETFQWTGKTAEAHRLAQQLLTRSKNLFGDVHPEVAVAWTWLVELEAELGNADRAKSAMQQALAIAHALYEEGHDDTQWLLWMQKGIHTLLKATPKDRQRFWKAFSDFQELPQLIEDEKYDEVIRRCETAIEVSGEVCGEESYIHLYLVNEVGLLYAEDEMHSEALSYFRYADERVRKVLGDDHYDTLSNLGQLIDTWDLYVISLEENSKFEKAFEEIQQQITFRKERVEGKDLFFKRSLAELLWNCEHLQKRVRESAEQRKQVREWIRTCRRYSNGLPDDVSRKESLTILERAKQAHRELVKTYGEENYLCWQCGMHAVILELRLYHIEAFNKSLKSLLGTLERRGMKNDYVYAEAQALLGSLLLFQGNLEQAHPLLENSYRELQLYSDPNVERFAIFSGRALAMYHERMGDTRRAFELVFELVQRSRSLLQAEQGPLGKLTHSSLMESLAPEVGSSGNSAPSLAQMQYATMCREMGRLSSKLGGKREVEERYALQSLHATRAVHGTQHPNYINSLTMLGWMYVRHGQFDRAKIPFQQALSFLQTQKRPDPLTLANSQTGFARLLLEEGNYADAEKLYRLGQPLFASSLGQNSVLSRKALADLARVVYAQGKHDEALRVEQQRLELKWKALDDVAGYASEAAMQQYLEDGRPSIDLLASIVHSEGEVSPEELSLLWNWGHRQKGILLDAICRTREGTVLFEADKELGSALDRANQIRRQLTQSAIHPPAGISSQQLQRTRKVLQAELAEIESRLKRELAQRSPNHLGEAQNQSLEAVRSRLPDDAVLIELIQYQPVAIASEQPKPSSRYLALLVRGGSRPSLDLVDLGDASAIDTLVSDLRAEMESTPRQLVALGEKTVEANYKKRAHHLYQKLFSPLQAKLQGCRSLYMVPEGPLHLVPFATLVDDEGRYLLERYRIACLSSTRDLLRPRALVPGKDVVVFAGPDFDLGTAERDKLVAKIPNRPPVEQVVSRGPALKLRFGWAPLEGAKKEADEISRILKASKWGKVHTFVGKEALEEQLLQVRSPRILHLATHGFFLEQDASETGTDRGWQARLHGSANPLLRSGIVLAGANRWKETKTAKNLDDGLLTAEEVALLRLTGTDLVVLSACESGLGDIRNSEGVYGLRRAFLYAGARSVLTSLFSVPDKETQQIMTRFYEGLAQGQTKLDALRSAQLGAMRARRAKTKSAHPFFWGSFQLIGDPGQEQEKE